MSILKGINNTENFSSSDYDTADSIRKENKIYSSSQDGKAPFVSADDIAAVAFRLLTATNQPFKSGKYDILGPELLGYSQVKSTRWYTGRWLLLTYERVGCRHIHKGTWSKDRIRQAVTRRESCTFDKVWIRRGPC
jgi:hypothetical protein